MNLSFSALRLRLRYFWADPLSQTEVGRTISDLDQKAKKLKKNKESAKILESDLRDFIEEVKATKTLLTPKQVRTLTAVTKKLFAAKHPGVRRAVGPIAGLRADILEATGHPRQHSRIASLRRRAGARAEHLAPPSAVQKNLPGKLPPPPSSKLISLEDFLAEGPQVGPTKKQRLLNDIKGGTVPQVREVRAFALKKENNNGDLQRVYVTLGAYHEDPEAGRKALIEACDTYCQAKNPSEVREILTQLSDKLKRDANAAFWRKHPDYGLSTSYQWGSAIGDAPYPNVI